MGRDAFDLFQDPDRGRFGDNEHAPVNDNGGSLKGDAKLLDFTLAYRDERPAALAVADPAKPKNPWIWLPKSQIEFAHAKGGLVEVTIPQWLAREKGLI